MKIEPTTPVPSYYQPITPTPSVGKALKHKLAEDEVNRIERDFKQEVGECRQDLLNVKMKIERLKRSAVQAVNGET